MFTKKIQPCRAFEQEQARFEVEFDGDPIPTVQWFREDYPIQSSPDFQIHTFGTKSILTVRQVIILFIFLFENNTNPKELHYWGTQQVTTIIIYFYFILFIPLIF